MSCYFCRHSVKSWWPEDEYAYEWQGTDKGKEPLFCTLNPKWMEVFADHFCSHETNDETAATKDVIRRRNRGAWGELGKQRSRAIKAEKKLKEVRKELRELKKQ